MGGYRNLYGSSRWRKTSERQRKREPLCAYCLSRGRITPATIADHVMPHKGDTTSFFHGKLQSLCKTCHDAAKAREEHGKAAFDENGQPIAPTNGW